MSRSTVSSLWHSRHRLSLLSFVLAVVLVVLNFFGEDFCSYLPEEARVESSFNEDVDYALESLNYMYELENGKAEIRPIIEDVPSFHSSYPPENTISSNFLDTFQNMK